MPLVCSKLMYLTRVSSRCQLVHKKHLFISWSPRRIKYPAHNFSTTAALSNEKSKSRTPDVSQNPFFDKYKSKIQHLQSSNPEEYEDRIKELSERLNPKPPSQHGNEGFSSTNPGAQPPKVAPPSDAARAGAGMTGSKSLSSFLKMELIQDKTPEEIALIWNQYHSGKDCIFAVLKESEYQNLMEKSKECPVFVYPIRRDDGFEFILSQFDRHEVYFTPLGMFQMVRENAPPCLTLTYYRELMHDKGIVLMNGQFDPKVLKQELALSLVQQLSIFYGINSKYHGLVQRFNYQPEKFQYQELIDALKSLPQYDVK